jgi:hypothetical protein
MRRLRLCRGDHAGLEEVFRRQPTSDTDSFLRLSGMVVAESEKHITFYPESQARQEKRTVPLGFPTIHCTEYIPVNRTRSVGQREAADLLSL